MFKKLALSLATTVVACAMLGSPAQALILNGPCSVLAHWSFSAPPTAAVAPGQFSTTDCPQGSLDTAHPAMLDPIPSVPNGQLGTHWEITLPNFIDDLNIKKIWIQIDTTTPADDFDLSVMAHDPTSQDPIPGILHEITQLGATAPTGFIAHFWVRPNPDWETIEIFTLSQAPITNVWVHTISMDIPEPATLALFGLGLAGLGFARRKRNKAA